MWVIWAFALLVVFCFYLCHYQSILCPTLYYSFQQNCFICLFVFSMQINDTGQYYILGILGGKCCLKSYPSWCWKKWHFWTKKQIDMLLQKNYLKKKMKLSIRCKRAVSRLALNCFILFSLSYHELIPPLLVCLLFCCHSFLSLVPWTYSSIVSVHGILNDSVIL